MLRRLVLLAAGLASAARGAGPVYSADSIVNGANFAAGPVAPNSLATIFGKDLAWEVETLTVENTAAGMLPNSLAGARVFVANYTAPLIYVSPTQINFLVPGNLRPGAVPVRVVRQGVTGPEVTITLVDAMPQFFQTADGYVIAQHADYSVVNAENPARAGEMIVVYATGLGITAPNPLPGEIPRYPGLMRSLARLRVSIGGRVLPPERVWYAGITPGFAGLYQINIEMPEGLEQDPEIRAAVGEQAGAEGLKLATGPR